MSFLLEVHGLRQAIVLEAYLETSTGTCKVGTLRCDYAVCSHKERMAGAYINAGDSRWTLFGWPTSVWLPVKSKSELNALSHISPVPRESPPSVSHTTAQKMIAITTTATPSVMHNTTITKRPKLSLQTTSLPATFGNSNTGLVARSCITASPTVRNTFSNAYDIRQTLSAIDSPSPSCRSADRSARHGSPFPFSNYRSDPMPYQQPLGVRSILRNSPLKKLSLGRRSVSISAGAIDNRRVYFPAKKQVSFRNQLEEEIKTVRYVARHSDIDSESEPELISDGADGSSSESSDSSESQSEHSSSGEDDGEAQDRPVRRRKRKSAPSERQIRAAALRDGLNNDRIAAALSAVPDSNSQKRRCKWRWTLGNSPSAEAESNLDTIPSAETIQSPPALNTGNDTVISGNP
ncbi:conserved hypothetical protein [Talaromyces stipitatus ATCC 10500]|uniref:Uncharacterized protein n=1 Tax=Talaromyces stipitatus (strain ATCC 10500 / CBS 375.48 / QM 6759 / NRRL 1006) TaxID=441959 RepID=B8LWM9_TALSN|nr:uncharacterized protein TSTA_077850 [Talaromyces stipitatus ATCC 10500]EED24426.1 conserved hypothetical protein [Talaromyces stipitatus ATCC 10500]